MTQLATAGGLKDALLAMDVVDEIRHRNADLIALADSGDEAALKRRLVDLYQSQGIEVSEEVIEQGIAARRERRYVYTRPTGWKAWLAKGWINRAQIGKRVAFNAMLLVASWTMVQMFIVRPLENRAQRTVASLNHQRDAAPRQVAAAQGAYAAAVKALEAAEVRVQSLKNGDRLLGLVTSGRSSHRASDDAVQSAVSAAGRTEIPRLVRTNGTTSVVGGSQSGSEATELVTFALRSVEHHVAKIADATAAVTAATSAITEGADASTLLDLANASAAAASLPKEADQLRQREFANGDAALRASNPAGARAAAANIDRIGPDVVRLATMVTRLEDLKAQGLATGVSGVDLDTFEGALQRVGALARIETAAQAEAALGDVEAMVSLLAADFTYRIVNRSGTKSGVWRYSNDNPGTRNHYLVVEALGATGQPATLPIRNEETGATESVSLFAVRVPEDEYNRVGADKKDNGIIEKDVIGKKARGRLSPAFDIPTAGGFITSW